MRSNATRIAALLVGISGAAWNAAALRADPAADAAADAGAPAFTEGRLWRVSRPGIDDSFVLGTIHVPDPRVALIAPPVEQALSRTRTLALERAPEDLLAAGTGDLEELDDGGRLEPLIGAEAYALLRDELVAHAVPEHVVQRMKPWAAMLRFARTPGSGNARSLVELLYLAARGRRMRVASLEGAADQVAAFDSVPLDSQVALLQHAVRHRDSLAATVEPTVAAWLRGDLAALARMVDDMGERHPGMREHYRRLVKHVVDDRTIAMHHRLFLPLRAGGVFVAVGAMHLYGDAGLLASLTRDGFRVTRVW